MGQRCSHCASSTAAHAQAFAYTQFGEQDGADGSNSEPRSEPQPEPVLHSAPHSSSGQTARPAARDYNTCLDRAFVQKEPRWAKRYKRLPDALLWPLKSAENLSFRSASVATHTHTSSPPSCNKLYSAFCIRVPRHRLRIARPKIHIVPAWAARAVGWHRTQPGASSPTKLAQAQI